MLKLGGKYYFTFSQPCYWKFKSSWVVGQHFEWQ